MIIQLYTSRRFCFKLCLHGQLADVGELLLGLAAELLRGVAQHLLAGAVDLDLGGADHADAHPLAGVHLGGDHRQRHRVQVDPLQGLET